MIPAAGYGASVLRRTLVRLNRWQLYPLLLVSVLALGSCSAHRKAFNPNKKTPPGGLQQDYDLFRTILEQKHPSLYWYSTEHQMDSAFDAGRLLLKDSMTEYEFRRVLALVVSNIQCGHTSVRASRSYQKYFDTLSVKRRFPLNIKTWDDTIVLTAPVGNTPMARGDIIDSINGMASRQILDTLLRFIPADGNNRVAKSQLLSGTSYFASLYTGVFGWPSRFRIAYTDSTGQARQALILPVSAPKDSSTGRAKKPAKSEKKSKSEQWKEQRSLRLSPDRNYAIMELNSFSEQLRLKQFFRKSFKTLADSGISHLVIDLRLNGGGRISNSNYLTQYLVNRPFKTGDSIYGKKPSLKYGRFIQNSITETTYSWLATQKTGKQYHFNRLENRYYKPRKKNHYNGQIYLLTGGYTYSASVLVLNAVLHQPNVTIIGEPSGGAAYGNTAMIIPDVTLPNTRVRFRLPLFRLVINKNLPKNGQGVTPDIYMRATPETIRKGTDNKLTTAIELINKNNAKYQ